MEVYFNPLSLYRERQCDRIRRREWQRFQSTLPIQGETNETIMEFVSNKFQSTLPIQGETYGRFSMSKLVIHFNPLSLYRERLGLFKDIRLAWIFQSTLPIQGETKRMGSISLIFAFQSTLPIQGETSCLRFLRKRN